MCFIRYNCTGGCFATAFVRDFAACPELLFVIQSPVFRRIVTLVLFVTSRLGESVPFLLEKKKGKHFALSNLEPDFQRWYRLL